MRNTHLPVLSLIVISPLAIAASAATTQPDQALYVANGGDGTIRQVALDGSMQVYASGLPIPRGLAFDASDNLYVACAGDNTIYKITPAGQKTAYATGIPNLYGLAIDGVGNLFAVDNGGAVASGALYLVDTMATVTIFAQVDHGGGVVIKGDDIYVTKSLSNLEVPEGIGGIYHINPSGVVSTFVGQMSDPIGLTVDHDGNLYAAEFVTPYEILKVTPAGMTHTYASGTLLGTPYGLAFDDTGLLYAADFTGNRVNTISSDGTVSVFAEGFDRPRFITMGPAISVPETSVALMIGVLSASLAFSRTRK